MLEIKEVLRLWQAGIAKKRIAAQLGIDPKTVRLYIEFAVEHGLRLDGELSEEQVAEVVGALRTLPPVAAPQTGAGLVEGDQSRRAG